MVLPFEVTFEGHVLVDYHSVVYRLTYRFTFGSWLTLPAVTAEDLAYDGTQHAFTEFYQRYGEQIRARYGSLNVPPESNPVPGSFQHPGQLIRWLETVARCYVLRELKIRGIPVDQDRLEDDHASEIDELPWLKQQLIDCFNLLDKEERVLVYKNTLFGVSCRDLAKRHKSSRNTVSRRLRAARLLLRRCLMDKGVDPADWI